MKGLYLLDTMVLSESFKRVPFASVAEWLQAVDSEALAVSVITFGEVAVGIEKQRQTDIPAFQRLSAWLGETQRDYADRTVPITTAIALRWGKLCARLKRRDTDLLIAATALEHGLTVVTRNVRHFEATGAKLLNPYQAA